MHATIVDHKNSYDDNMISAIIKILSYEIREIFRNDVTFISLSMNSKLLTLNVWILFVDGIATADSEVCCKII